MRIVYDITKPCIEELRGGFRMAGMGRVARAWARGVSRMDGGLLMSALPESMTGRVVERVCMSDAPLSRDRWKAASDTLLNSVMDKLLSRSGKDRSLYSRGCGSASHHLTARLAARARVEVLKKCPPTTGAWIYHMPLPDPLPPKLPPGCIAVGNVYDVIPWIFRDSYTARNRQNFTNLLESFKRLRAHVIVNSIDTRHSLVSQFDMDPARIHVVPLGCDERITRVREHPEPEPFLEGHPYMLYVASSGQRRKNIPTVIRAFSRFAEGRNDAPQLVIAGGGTQLHQPLADSLQVGGGAKVHCLGYVDERRLEALYAHARLGLYLSLYEGFGLPILEYMIREVPVISGNETSLPEVAGEAALLVDSTDIGAIATVMSELWVDRERRQALAAVGLARAREHSWEQSFMRLKSCYHSILTSED